MELAKITHVDNVNTNGSNAAGDKSVGEGEAGLDENFPDEQGKPVEVK